MSERVVIVDYDAGWPVLFAQIAEQVRRALGDLAVAVEHVGSTAVPGLAAKPIIDVDVVVRSERDVPLAIEQLERIGYRHRGDLGIPGREAFAAPSNTPPQHLYVVVEANQAHLDHVRWRDLLRQDAAIAREYGELKFALAEQHGTDRDGFTEAKTEFITAAMMRSGFPFRGSDHDERTSAMALGFYFTPKNFTPADYDEVIKRLEEAGAGAPAGRLYHAALEVDGQVQVFDVWDSQDSLDAFGATLGPIMAAHGADPGQPMVSNVHNVIEG